MRAIGLRKRPEIPRKLLPLEHSELSFGLMNRQKAPRVRNICVSCRESQERTAHRRMPKMQKAWCRPPEHLILHFSKAQRRLIVHPSPNLPELTNAHLICARPGLTLSN